MRHTLHALLRLLLHGESGVRRETPAEIAASLGGVSRRALAQAVAREMRWRASRRDRMIVGTDRALVTRIAYGVKPPMTMVERGVLRVA